MVHVSKSIKDDPLLNNAYSKYFFELSFEDDNVYGLTKKINKTNGIIYTQIQFLLKKNYIKPSKVTNKKNAYKLNYQKLIDRFSEYVCYPKTYKLKNNNVLIQLLKRIFSMYRKKKDELTIMDVFYRLTIMINFLALEQRKIKINDKDIIDLFEHIITNKVYESIIEHNALMEFVFLPEFLSKHQPGSSSK